MNLWYVVFPVVKITKSSCDIHLHTLSYISVQSLPAPLINCAFPPGWNFTKSVMLYTLPRSHGQGKWNKDVCTSTIMRPGTSEHNTTTLFVSESLDTQRCFSSRRILKEHSHKPSKRTHQEEGKLPNYINIWCDLAKWKPPRTSNCRPHISLGGVSF